MAKENTTIYTILGLLHHQDLSGYDIKKAIDRSISYFYDAGYGQIYPTLKTLEKGGLVVKRNKPDSKGPAGYIYSITPDGEAHLTHWLGQPAEKEYVKYEILLKLFFGSLLPVEENLGVIENFKKRTLPRVETMQQYLDSLKPVLSEKSDHYYDYLTVLFGRYVYQAYLDWAEEAKVLLGQLKG